MRLPGILAASGSFCLVAVPNLCSIATWAPGIHILGNGKKEVVHPVKWHLTFSLTCYLSPSHMDTSLKGHREAVCQLCLFREKGRVNRQ